MENKTEKLLTIDDLSNKTSDLSAIAQKINLLDNSILSLKETLRLSKDKNIADPEKHIHTLMIENHVKPTIAALSRVTRLPGSSKLRINDDTQSSFKHSNLDALEKAQSDLKVLHNYFNSQVNHAATDIYITHGQFLLDLDEFISSVITDKKAPSPIKSFSFDDITRSLKKLAPKRFSLNESAKPIPPLEAQPPSIVASPTLGEEPTEEQTNAAINPSR